MENLQYLPRHIHDRVLYGAGGCDVLASLFLYENEEFREGRDAVCEMNCGQYRRLPKQDSRAEERTGRCFHIHTSEKPTEMEETDISSLQSHRVTVVVKIITINHKAL
jgi:hypothetical protein